MRPALTFLTATMALSAVGQNSEVAFQPNLPGRSQPEHHLTIAEKSGWKEIESERTLHSATYALENKRISYSSVAPVNFQGNNGNLIPVDTRPAFQNGKWQAMQQPTPVVASLEGSFQIFNSGGESPEYSKTLNINGLLPQFSSAPVVDGQFLWFHDVVPGVSKQLIFGQGNMKYNYVVDQPAANTTAPWTVKEKVTLPEGARIMKNKNKSALNEPDILIQNLRGELIGAIHPLVCYDNHGQTVVGNIEIISYKSGQAIIELQVPGDWFYASDRAFPIIVDPLVTGAVNTWSGGSFPSCFFPNYYSEPVLTVTIPAGITVTHLGMTTNFYASPFTTTVMADGRMFFSTDCGQTNVFQVQPPEGNLAGTAYMENFNLMSPLMCCHPQQCTSFTVDVRMHLSRTSNGPDCNLSYLYYDPFSLWPFSCFAEGYTPEAYAQTMTFSPSATLCADECEVNARIYARYGVPPYTFTHPWGTETVVAGVPDGCSTGNIFGLVPLAIPDCPTYCDPSTSKSVPPPVVTDACGTNVVLYNPSYNLNIKPVIQLTPIFDTLLVCSGEQEIVGWNTCLSNGTVQWDGNGTSGNTLTIDILYTNTGSAPQFVVYSANATLNGCTGPISETVVQVNPMVVQDFSMNPDPVVVTNTTNFIDQSSLNGNSIIGYLWNFGVGSIGSNEPSPNYVFDEPGEYEVCFELVTEEGCSGVFCKNVLVVPAELVLPNIITPNGDNTNDALVIKYIDSYENNELHVFNRWGNLVYEKSKYTNDWKATGLEDGVYFYTVSLPNGKSYSSSLQIKR